MTDDIFAKIGDIKGESTDAKHKDEIEVLSFSWGVATTPPTGGGAGGGAGKATFQDLTIVHPIDKATPALLQACATGRHLKDATITHRKAGGSQQRIPDRQDEQCRHHRRQPRGPRCAGLRDGQPELRQSPPRIPAPATRRTSDAPVHFKFDVKTGKVLGHAEGGARWSRPIRRTRTDRRRGGPESPSRCRNSNSSRTPARCISACSRWRRTIPMHCTFPECSRTSRAARRCRRTDQAKPHPDTESCRRPQQSGHRVPVQRQGGRGHRRLPASHRDRPKPCERAQQSRRRVARRRQAGGGRSRLSHGDQPGSGSRGRVHEPGHLAQWTEPNGRGLGVLLQGHHPAAQTS